MLILADFSGLNPRLKDDNRPAPDDAGLHVLYIRYEPYYSAATTDVSIS